MIILFALLISLIDCFVGLLPTIIKSLTLEGYTNALRDVLDVCLTLQDFPSEIVEKHNKPEIELNGYNKKTKSIVLHPVYLARSDREKCLIEPSINSCRVIMKSDEEPKMISFLLKKNDELDTMIAQKFSKYFMVRADQFQILRRKALEGYDVSFLITNDHLEKYKKKELIEFIVGFIGNVEKDLSDIKLNIIQQARKSITFFAKAISKDL